jgi:hypothetical protein
MRSRVIRRRNRGLPSHPIVQLGGFLFPEKSYAASPTRMLRLRLRKDVIRVGAWLVRLYKVIWRLRELSVPA